MRVRNIKPLIHSLINEGKPIEIKSKYICWGGRSALLTDLIKEGYFELIKTK